MDVSCGLFVCTVSLCLAIYSLESVSANLDQRCATDEREMHPERKWRSTHKSEDIKDIEMRDR